MSPFIISLGLIPILGIFGQWLAWRIRLPSIVVLLVMGFLAGPGLSLIDADAVFGDSLYPFVSLLVSIIVFEGGLSLRIRDLKHIGAPLFRLVILAPFLTIGMMYVFTHYIVGLSPSLSIMFSALMVITGPTVIIPLLRHINVGPQLSALIRWEGILIAPIGTFIIVLVYQSVFVSTEHVLVLTLMLLVKIMLVAFGLSSAGALLIVTLFKRQWVPDFLQELVTLVMVLGIFLVSNAIQQDSGVLTVVVLGIILANQQQVSLQHIKVFKENLRILSISTLFIVLSSRLNVGDVVALLDVRHGLYVVGLITVVRPVATLVALWGSSLGIKERAVMAWVAPRGIVTASIASLFALRLVGLGVPDAEALVPLTFLVLIATVMVYGFTLNPFIRWLSLENSRVSGVLVVGGNPFAVAVARLLNRLPHFATTVVDLNRDYVQCARIEGVQAIHGSVFSSRVVEDMHLGLFRDMIALTDNDELNSLACIRYDGVIGSEHVFRIPPAHMNAGQTDGIKKMGTGQMLMADDFYHVSSVFSNTQHMAWREVDTDMSMDDFATLVGYPFVLILGVSNNGALRSAKGVTQVKAGDMWAVLKTGGLANTTSAKTTNNDNSDQMNLN
jgi:NhaP-type Na+/H+ or K+/H+ antiporter